MNDVQSRFRALFQRSYDRILAYAMRRTNTPDDAADAVSDVYRIAWQHLDQIPDDDREILWLYATARRVVANLNRGARRRGRLVEKLSADLSVHPRYTEPAPEELDAGRAARHLAEEDREILMLSAWEGLTSAELARTLGCSPVAARLRLSRARARLNALLADDGTTTKQPSGPGHIRTQRQPRTASHSR